MHSLGPVAQGFVLGLIGRSIRSMSARITTLLGVAAILGVASLGAASIANADTLQNDGFVAGDAAGFQAGFVAGEEGAVELTPPSANPWKLDNVQFLFGGAVATQTVTLNIYADSAGADPGAVLFTADYQVTGADNALSEIDLGADNVVVTGDFRVGIAFQHAGLPSIARDDDGSIAATKNFIEVDGIGWVQSNLVGLTGDWVIRANATEQGGTPTADAGPSAPDAGVSGTPDAGATTDDTCTLNSDCTNGSYCGDDALCTFDCRVDIDCNGDFTCDEVGRCVEPESSDGGGCNTSGGAPLGLLAGLFMMVLLFRRRA